MPLPTRNPGALITTVGGIHPARIIVYVNSIAALQIRTVEFSQRRTTEVGVSVGGLVV